MTSSKPSIALHWQTSSSILYCQPHTFVYRQRVAAFDFDHTIATPNGSHIFPKNGDDYKLFNTSVCAIMVALSNVGYCLLIFSNQKHVLQDSAKSMKALLTFKGRVEKFVNEMQIYCKTNSITPPPVMVMAACEDDFFRKPRPGMFYWFILQLTISGIAIDSEFRLIRF
jgi:bifunctional polynucleotide phosphatase/kinase